MPVVARPAGGRPRRTCSARCKRRRDRTLRQIARRERWHAGAVARGYVELAAQIEAGTDALRHGALSAPAIRQDLLVKLHHDEQQRLRARWNA
jgi:hypothetical protein